MGERGGRGAPGGITGGVYGYGVPLTASLLQQLLAAAPGTQLPSLEPSAAAPGAATPPPPAAVPLAFRHADVLGTNLLQRTADVELPALGAAEPAAPEPGASQRSPPTPPLVAPLVAPKAVKKKRIPRRRSKPAAKGGGRSRIGKHRGTSRHPTIKGRWEVNASVKKKLTYIGGFDDAVGPAGAVLGEDRAGRAYDLVAIRCRGSHAETNFPMSDYGPEVMAALAAMTPEELVQLLRRR